MNRRTQLLAFVAAAIVLSQIPYLHVPLKWFETLFHESSHALAAFLTGGHVARIALHADGSGLTWSSGGIRPLVTFAGYAGAIAWGALLYALATAVRPTTARAIVIGMLVLGILEALTWLAFSLTTYAIMAVILGLLVMLLSPRAAPLAQPALRLIGAYVLVSAIVSPSYILQAGQSSENDAAALASQLWVPSIVWVAIWLALGVAAVVGLYRLEGRVDRGQVATR